MNRKRQSQIEDLAVSLLYETGCYTSPPIDVVKVAARKGIEIIEHDFGDDISGVLMTNPTGTYIGINKNNWPNRQRFTIAHELGHFVLGHQREGLFVDTPDKYFTIFNFRNAKSSTGEYLQEREANAFAAALLMPEKLIISYLEFIRDVVDVKDEGTDIVDLLAKQFMVSNQAMGLRLSNFSTLW